MANPKTILILKQSGASLEKAETFLKNRGWVVMATTNLRTALEFTFEHEPVAVLLSVDYPEAHLIKVEKFVTQHSRAQVIRFSESGTMAMLNLLASDQDSFSIKSVVTGPAIERAVFHAISSVYPKEERARAGALSNSALTAFMSVFGSNSLSDDRNSYRIRKTHGFALESPMFSGVFVAAGGESTSDFKERVVQFSREMARHLSKAGEPVFRLIEVTVESEWWEIQKQLDKSTFQLSGAYANEPVDVAYFPIPAISEQQLALKKKGLIACSLDWIRPDQVLDHDLLLHLPTNERTMVYVRRGNILPSDIKTKLKAKGLQEVFVRVEDLPQVLKIRAQHYLREIVYQQQKAI